MNKKQSIFLKLGSPIYFLAFLMIVITICFVIFTPRVSSLIFSQKRDMTYNSFVSKTQNNQKLDPQEFWKLREFYSPGYFELKDQGLENSNVQSAVGEIGLTPKDVTYTSLFRARHSISLDGLTEVQSLDEIIDTKSIQNITFQNENTVIFTNDENYRIIIFLLPVSEMKKANGFFEYDGKDKNFLENKNWFNITMLKD